MKTYFQLVLAALLIFSTMSADAQNSKADRKAQREQRREERQQKREARKNAQEHSIQDAGTESDNNDMNYATQKESIDNVANLQDVSESTDEQTYNNKSTIAKQDVWKNSPQQSAALKITSNENNQQAASNQYDGYNDVPEPSKTDSDSGNGLLVLFIIGLIVYSILYCIYKIIRYIYLRTNARHAKGIMPCELLTRTILVS